MLINSNTGKIIGIITRKEDGISEEFKYLENDLKEIIKGLQDRQKENNAELVKNLESIHLINYRMFLSMIEQLKRSINVGIGYAFEIDNIISDIGALRECRETK